VIERPLLVSIPKQRRLSASCSGDSRCRPPGRRTFRQGGRVRSSSQGRMLIGDELVRSRERERESLRIRLGDEKGRAALETRAEMA
jgi:hypothetical protein